MKFSAITTLALVAVAAALPVVKKEDQLGELVGQIEDILGKGTGNLDGDLSGVLSGLVGTLLKTLGLESN